MPALARLDPLEDARRRGLVRMDDPNRDPRQRPVAQAEDDRAQFLSVDTLRQQYTDYLNNKVEEIEEQKLSRRYYHGAFYSAEELRVLKDRHQPPLPWNRTQRNINRHIGLVQRLRSDPKAVGNNPKSEQGAEISTQSIRSVLSSNQWKSQEWWCLLQCGIDGISGVQRVLKPLPNGNKKIVVDWVIADEYFYDPNCYRFDFSDLGYEGISKWFKIDDALELFPDKEDQLLGLLESGSDLTTNPDREIKWTMTTAQKVRIVEHWYRHRGEWKWAFYTGRDLLDQGLSPFFDDDGKTTSSFNMFCASVDHDGDRYGFVRNIKGPQDGLNAGKSKTLHLANTKQVKLTKGAVDDVEILRRELMRPDGTIEVNPGFEKGVEIIDTKQDLAAFVAFTEDAKAELDKDSDNLAQMSSGQMMNLSGRAIELLRQPGMAELGPFILSVRAWKLKLYRDIWNAAQRHWTKQMWLRVANDNGGLAQFIELNGLGLDEFGRPAIVNAVGSLDVDIELDEGQDVATVMQDTYDALKGYPPGTFPPQILIELNPNIPRSEKNRILQMMAPKPQPPNPLQELISRLTVEGLAGKNAKVAAEIERILAQADREKATAEEKREGIADADTGLMRDAAQFARETIFKAAAVANPPQGQQGPGGRPMQPPSIAPPMAHGM